MMNNVDFANKAKDIAENYKTLYIKGCFGSPMNNTNKKRYCNNNAYNQKPERTKMIQNSSSDTFGFDCVCLIKGILWNWSGKINATYGGAVYASNGVPDVGADAIMNYCTGVSTDFSNIEIGEIVHMKGHVGIYIGNGLAVECTPSFQNKVQITAVGNIGPKEGYKTRTWLNHGKVRFVDYSSVPIQTPNKYPYKATIPKETDLYNKEGNKYKNPCSKDRVVTVQGMYNGMLEIYGDTFNPHVVYCREDAINNPSKKYPYEATIPKGTILYNKDKKKYKNSCLKDRKVTVEGEYNGMLKVYGDTFNPHIVYCDINSIK